jgi:zinc transport system substrate-binding protein
MPRKILNFLLLAVLILLPSTSWNAERPSVRVVVSIKPIHSLVANIMAGVEPPQLLVRSGGSPHGYALRPSEARALHDAQLVIWVGPELESFLERPLKSLQTEIRQLRLADSLQGVLLPVRAGGHWEKPHGHAHPENDAHAAKDFDPHLWLGPAQAKRIVEVTVAALGDVDPANRDRYRTNGKKLQARLDALQVELAQQLAPVTDIPYIVFHDAYQYFEQAFDLNVVGSVTLDPERSPGIRRILEIRSTIRELGARCVFSEPQFEPRLVATVIEDTAAATGTLDPIGAELPEGPDAYFILMHNLADALVKGLQKGG